jgi:hypothetical protein
MSVDALRGFDMFWICGGRAVFLAIVAYMAPRIIPFGTIGDNLVAGLAKHLGAYGELTRAFAAFMVLWLMLWYMYRKKTFVRV